jgi:thiosulfate/3-mercaptopyruvate sulfurtransferase
MTSANLIRPEELAAAQDVVVIDCRFALTDPSQGRTLYLEGHIPGAHYLDLNEDLSGPAGLHGGRHPLPDPGAFIATLAALGIGGDSLVVAYDDSRLAYAARLWWMMRSLDFKPPRLLDGGHQGWLALGEQVETTAPAKTGEAVVPAASGSGRNFSGVCDIVGLRKAQDRGALLVDSREARRYQGLEEPIDPVAGHIPGAINRPWQGVTTETGEIRPLEEQRAHLGDLTEAEELVVYCGSGVTACVNLFSLALAGKEDAILYSGSWSDWCSHLGAP